MKTKMKLSSNVLQMKFMKRTAIERQEELAFEEQQRQIDDEHWYLDIDKEKKVESNVGSVIVESSYSIFDGVGFGRMSFNGFNPQIEKLMKPTDEESKQKSDSDEKEINDEEMAEHFSNSLETTINKKFVAKRFFKQTKGPKAKRLAT
ncbi:M-phase phospho 6 [Brachionus plicatilis]|uniref:M-phase phospho 6 n=1 Tax=Brachionus plicatilis TaxID=10195 RepID=A0A3M7SDF9_BRAPC|nr:M-phase phospho 6 [Brachionus plicatilis]